MRSVTNHLVWVGVIVVAWRAPLAAEVIDLRSGRHDQFDVVDGRGSFTVLGDDALEMLRFLGSNYRVNFIAGPEARSVKIDRLEITDGDFAQAAEAPLRAMGLVARPGPGGILHLAPRTDPAEPSVIMAEPLPPRAEDASVVIMEFHDVPAGKTLEVAARIGGSSLVVPADERTHTSLTLIMRHLTVPQVIEAVLPKLPGATLVPGAVQRVAWPEDLAREAKVWSQRTTLAGKLEETLELHAERDERVIDLINALASECSLALAFADTDSIVTLEPLPRGALIADETGHLPPRKPDDAATRAALAKAPGLARRFHLALSRAPAGEALEAVLRSAGVGARLEGRTLVLERSEALGD